MAAEVMNRLRKHLYDVLLFDNKAPAVSTLKMKETLVLFAIKLFFRWLVIKFGKTI